jgi:transcriptional regulator with XRE-family HTH domain
MPPRPSRRTTKGGPEDAVPDDKLAQFATNVRNTRLSRGMTQAEMADAADLTLTYTTRIEAGTANVTFRTMERLAAALGTSIVTLINAL